jgi:ribosomal protein L25 (general stress protein Ctc)
MPLPAAAVPILIDAAAQVGSTAFNAISQAGMNRKTRKWNEKMYGVQRRDALADFTMQNDYNSPTSQMERLREAGLNPNLVYGRGADNTSQAVRSTDTKSWNPSAPKAELSGGLMQSMDVVIKQAQVDNLKAQNTVLLQDALLKKTQTENISGQTAKTAFELDVSQSLREISAEMKRGELRKINADIDYTLDENERKTAQNTSSLKQAAEQILTMRAQRSKVPSEIAHIKSQIDLLQTDKRLKELDIELRKEGVQPTDNFFLRLLGRVIAGQSSISTEVQSVGKDIGSGIKNVYNKLFK